MPFLFHSRIALLLAALLAGWTLSWLHLPGAWLIGPLVVSAVFAVLGGARVFLPVLGYRAVQAVIGVALSFSVSLSSLAVLKTSWLPVSALVGAMLVLTVGNAWLLIRFAGLDASTALIGTLPGGAGQMVAMSESLGADGRLVAVMQYTRLLCIIFTVSLVAHFVTASAAHVVTTTAVAEPHILPWSWSGLLVSILAAVIGATLGERLRVPAGALVVPTILAVLWHIFGPVPAMPWPRVLLAGAYVALGLQIGSRFEPGVIERLRQLAAPILITSVFLLLGSAGLAWWLVQVLPRESLLTAYLAATPGGIDSVAVLAADLKADATLVLAVHFLRLMAVLVIGPTLIAKLATRMPRRLSGQPAADVGISERGRNI